MLWELECAHTTSSLTLYHAQSLLGSQNLCWASQTRSEMCALDCSWTSELSSGSHGGHQTSTEAKWLGGRDKGAALTRAGRLLFKSTTKRLSLSQHHGNLGSLGRSLLANLCEVTWARARSCGAVVLDFVCWNHLKSFQAPSAQTIPPKRLKTTVWAGF